MKDITSNNLVLLNNTEANEPLESSTKNHRLVLNTKVYIHTYVEKFHIPANNEILIEKGKYQLLFLYDRTRLVFDRQVIGNVRDKRFTNNNQLRELTGEEINNLLNKLNKLSNE